MNRYLLFVLILLFPYFAGAQNTLYFMDNLPQSMSLNPAFAPKVDFFMGTPMFSGASVQVYNSAFNMNELQEFTDNITSPGFDADRFLNSLDLENQMLAETKFNLFSLGFRIKEKSFLSFSVDVNNNIVAKSPTDIMYLFVDTDDIPSENFPIDIKNVNLSTTSFMSFGATYSYQVNDNLTLGISPKINYSSFAMETENLSYKVELDGEEDYNKSVSGKFLMGLFTEMSPELVNQGDVEFDENFELLPDYWQEDFRMKDLFRNSSLTVDFGAMYNYKKWMFSASVLNLGSSVFKSNIYNIAGNEEYINVKEVKKAKFAIPTKVIVGAVHQFSSKWNYGIMLNNTFYKDNQTPTATVSLNGYVGKWLSTTASYTAGYRFDNLGFGLRLRFLPGTDFYFVTDNIIQAFNYKNAHRLTAAVGINMLFGMKNVENNIPESKSSL